MAKRQTPEERFHSRYVIQDNGCWQWIGTINRDGYGEIHIAGVRTHATAAHRFAYEILVAPIPAGLSIDHLCRNPGCVNPAHLEPVTLAENTRRQLLHQSRREHKSVCPHGHPLEGNNIYLRHDRGHRECRTCKNKRRRDYAARTRAPR